MSSSSSSVSCPETARLCSGLGSVGEAARFVNILSGIASTLLVVFGVGDDFCVKKLEMVACFRFKDGEGAEDWEEWGAIVPGGPDLEDNEQFEKWRFSALIHQITMRAVMPCVRWAPSMLS